MDESENPYAAPKTTSSEDVFYTRTPDDAGDEEADDPDPAFVQGLAIGVAIFLGTVLLIGLIVVLWESATHS